MISYLDYLRSRTRPQLFAVMILLVAAVGMIDYVTGAELSFSAFYLVPVAFGAWFLGRRVSVGVSVASATVWFLSDSLTAASYSHPLIPYWNALVMSGMFVVTALVLSRLKQTLDRDDRLARDVQKGLLPTETLRIPGYDIVGAWRPAQSVGGDYYDFFRLNNESVALCVGDASGHGIPAALLVSNLQAAVRMLAIGDLQPHKICAELNKFMYGNTSQDKFITFFYAVLNIHTKTLIYANAGHDRPILLRRNGVTVPLGEAGFALGLFVDSQYEQGSVQLEGGDFLLIYTDGVTEARNLQDEEFGEGRLLDVLKESRGMGAGAVCDGILKHVSAFSNDFFQDDLTLLTVGVHTTDGV